MKRGSSFGVRLLQAGLALVVVAAAIIALRDPLDIDDRPHIQPMLRLAADSLQADIAADMEAQILAQVRLAQLWKLQELSLHEWNSAAQLFLDHHPGYVAVQWLDRRYLARQAPVLRGDVDSAPDILSGNRLWDTLQSAAPSTDYRVITTGIKLQNGTPGYLVIVPSFAGEELTGFLVGVCDVKKTLDRILSDHALLGYSIAVLDRSGQLYQTDSSSSENRKEWSEVAKVALAALDWRVEVWPKPDMLAGARSRLPELGVALGVLLILLLASTIHSARMLHIKSVHLAAAHDEMEQRVHERTAELKQANDFLRAEITERSRMEEALRKLSSDILHLQDEERRRIARELHDSTAQTLSALKINLRNLQKQASAGDRSSCKLLDQSAQFAEQALCEIRTMSYLLHPPILEDLGLESALSWYAAGFTERSGIQTHIHIDPDLGRFSQDVELILFRIVQEALGNIHRHSGSHTANISLSQTSTAITLLVSDQGRGLSKEIVDLKPGTMPRVGVGVMGMRERVRQLGGELEISSDGNGTAVKAVLPYAEVQWFASVA